MEEQMSVKAIPEGYHTITPYLMVNDAEAVIDFLKAAFGAEVVCITNGPVALDGKRMIGNAEVRVGTSMIMLADARPDVPSQNAMLYLYCDDVDAMHAQALKAGGTEMMPPTDMFYGDRNSGIVDPSGNSWFIASRIEDLEDDELQRRANAYHAEQR
jgi:uncharacterized glyoxalase superfamily protein PhnB